MLSHILCSPANFCKTSSPVAYCPVSVSYTHLDVYKRQVVDQVEREHDRVVITKHGRPAAVVVSVEDLASLEETLDVMARPRLIAQIRDSLAEMAAEPATPLTKEQALELLRR